MQSLFKQLKVILLFKTPNSNTEMRFMPCRYGLEAVGVCLNTIMFDRAFNFMIE